MLRAALRSDAFVERSWGAVAALAGRDAAIDLLPADILGVFVYIPTAQ